MRSTIEKRRLVSLALLLLLYWVFVLLFLIWLLSDFIPPQALSLGSLELKLYPICLSLGAALALIIFERDYLPKLKINYAWDLLAIFVFGVIGARAFYIMVNLDDYNSLASVLNLSDGGLVIWGAMLAGLVYLFIKYKNKKDLFWNYLAAILTVLPLAQAFGRWGNYFNRELFGPSAEPLFLIESAVNIILFGFLYLNPQLPAKKTIGLYLLVYGLVRLVLQPLRPDSQAFAISSYIISLVIIFLGLLLQRSKNFSHK